MSDGCIPRLALIALLVAALVGACSPGETQVTVRNDFGSEIYVVFAPDSTEPPQAFRVGNATSAVTLAGTPGWKGRAIVYEAPGCGRIAEVEITSARVLLLASAEGGVGVGNLDDSASPEPRIQALPAVPC